MFWRANRWFKREEEEEDEEQGMGRAQKAERECPADMRRRSKTRDWGHVGEDSTNGIAVRKQVLFLEAKRGKK
jgi:hypothetical protein